MAARRSRPHRAERHPLARAPRPARDRARAGRGCDGRPRAKRRAERDAGGGPHRAVAYRRAERDAPRPPVQRPVIRRDRGGHGPTQIEHRDVPRPRRGCVPQGGHAMSDDVERMMSVPDPAPDSERALARIRERVERERIRPVTSAPPRIVRGPIVSLWLKGLAAAASVALIAVLLTASGVAETILTIFEPKQVTAVQITPNDIATAVSGLESFGTLTWSTPPKPFDVPDAKSAASESGLTVVQPGTLPAGVTAANVRYGVVPKTTATFTFSADKTRQAASRLGRTPPPMPANIDGSKLFITGGPGVVQIYGSVSSPPTLQRPQASGSSTAAADALASLPALVIAQGRAPVVQSNGVTVEQLQQYLLAQPGVTPELAAQIRAIKDPSSTLPIPIPVNMATSKNVTVQGVPGVFVGDSTGLGSAVIWQKDGVVYGVAGTLSESEIMTVANSLH